MAIYLIRHTRVKLGAGICYGQSDVPLADSYRDEWERLRAKLPSPETTRVFSSPLSRCRLLAEFLHADVRMDSRLSELDFGRWELQSWDAIDRQEFEVWSTDFVTQSCPGGESYQEQFQRARAFWDECVVGNQEPADVFLVTHSGSIRALLAHVLGIPLQKSIALGLDFGSVTKIHFVQDVPIVDYVNR